MTQEKDFKQIDKDLHRLDQDTLKTNTTVLRLTKWIAFLTFVMIVVGIVQLLVMWPKRTYCVNATATVQICEPDYYPFDSNPLDIAYKLDKKFGNN